MRAGRFAGFSQWNGSRAGGAQAAPDTCLLTGTSPCAFCGPKRRKSIVTKATLTNLGKHGLKARIHAVSDLIASETDQQRCVHEVEGIGNCVHDDADVNVGRELDGGCLTAQVSLQNWEQANGLRIRLVMLSTILSKLKRGLAESFFHSGSLRKTSHCFSSSAMSVKLSM